MLFMTIMWLAAVLEVVSKTSAYNITKLSYRVEVRVCRIFIDDELPSKKPCSHT